MKGVPVRQWLTVSAEAIAIVASILVAFAIDAWWEERNDQRWQTEQLMALRDEFAANQEALTWVRRMDERFAETIEGILDELRAHEPGDVIEVEKRRLGALAAWRTSDVATGALDALLASGRLGDIENAELRQALAGWPSAVLDVQEDESLARDFLPNVLVPTLLGQGLIDAVYEFSSPADFRAQRESDSVEMVPVPVSRELIEIAAVRVWNTRLAEMSVRRLQGRLERILDMLDAELARRGVDRPPPDEEAR